VTLAVLGMGVHAARARGAALVAGLLPAFAILSFTLCFNFAALRSDDRFLLPQAVLACIYIGIAAEVAAFAARPWMRLAARAGLAVAALFALHHAIAINAAFLFDPRYDAEAWMARNIKPGDTVESYGQNCFQPRFPRDARVSRVGQGDLKLRNPLPGVTEIRAPFGRRATRILSSSMPNGPSAICAPNFPSATDMFIPGCSRRISAIRTRGAISRDCEMAAWDIGWHIPRAMMGFGRPSIFMTAWTKPSGFSSGDRTTHPDLPA
jgi:hypothetical protein